MVVVAGVGVVVEVAMEPVVAGQAAPPAVWTAASRAAVTAPSWDVLPTRREVSDERYMSNKGHTRKF